MLKLGIEPKTFALLARRSNQLSYSSTEFCVSHFYIIVNSKKKELSKWVGANREDTINIVIQDIPIIPIIPIIPTIVQEEVEVGVEVGVKVLKTMISNHLNI